MKMQPGKLLKPTEKELDLIKKIDEIYSSGMGREFENLVRTAINSEKERGHVAEFNPSGTFYAIDPSYLPDDEHRDIFRRLCRVSPSEPVDFGANRENGNFRTLSVLCQVEVVEVDAAASENAKIDPNLT